MCGRVSAVSKRPVFDLVRERAGFGPALATLIASQIVNLMTCAAEVGGVAICFQLLSGLPYRLLIPLAVVALVLCSWVLPFEWLERVFGYAGLGMLVFAVAAIKLHPEWGEVAHGFVPGLARRRQPLRLPLLRGRPAGRRDDAVRGLLLLVGRGGGSLGRQGPQAQQRDRDDRVRARRLPLVLADDRRGRALPAGGHLARVPRDAGPRRGARARADRAADRARRHPLRGGRRGRRDVVRRRLQRLAVLRLAVGEEGAARAVASRSRSRG